MSGATVILVGLGAPTRVSRVRRATTALRFPPVSVRPRLPSHTAAGARLIVSAETAIARSSPTPARWHGPPALGMRWPTGADARTLARARGRVPQIPAQAARDLDRMATGPAPRRGTLPQASRRELEDLAAGAVCAASARSAVEIAGAIQDDLSRRAAPIVDAVGALRAAEEIEWRLRPRDAQCDTVPAGPEPPTLLDVVPSRFSELLKTRPACG